MLDLSKDEHCLFVEQRLVDYALAVGMREQARRDFFGKKTNNTNLEDDPTYERQRSISLAKKNIFYKSFNEYMAKFEKLEDKQQVNGHFWWGIKSIYYTGKLRKKDLALYSRDFLNEGLSFINDVVCRKPMSSLDKVRLLEHLVANDYLDKKDKNGVNIISEESLNRFRKGKPRSKSLR